MGTAVDNVDKTWTCQDGKFYVGMKKEEAENMKNSLFTNYSKEFDKVDKDGDGVLSDDEVTAKKEVNKKENLILAIWDGLIALTFGVCAAINHIQGSRFGYAVSAILMSFCGGMELNSSLTEGDEIKAHKAIIEVLKQDEAEKDKEEALSLAA